MSGATGQPSDPRGPLPTDIDWQKPHEIYPDWQDEPGAEGFDLYACGGCGRSKGNFIHNDEDSIAYRLEMGKYADEPSRLSDGPPDSLVDPVRLPNGGTVGPHRTARPSTTGPSMWADMMAGIRLSREHLRWDDWRLQGIRTRQLQARLYVWAELRKAPAWR